MSQLVSPLAVACVVLGVAGAQAAPQLRPEAPCGIFLRGEPVRFAVEGGDLPEAELVAVDEMERRVWAGRGEGATVELPPLGNGWYELRWTAPDGTPGRAPFGVVPARPDTAPPDGPVCIDVAMAWLSRPDQWAPIARMLRRIGVGTVRERLSWGQVAPEPGKLDWQHYETVADALQAEGVREYQIFHDTPGWTHPDRDTKAPDDLRVVYRFCKEGASHFRGRIIAWEPWNEPDISFFDAPGDRMAAIQKAAYLGTKAGNPEAQVLQVSLCAGRTSFSDNLYECGIADYVDAFNFHTYDDIRGYRDSIQRWVAMPEAYGIGELPIWLTEAGVRLPFVEDGQELSLASERAQAEFLPKSYAISLSSGVDKHFFFVLPFYPEGSIQFGALEADLGPRPAVLALATTARVLGAGRYLGRLWIDGEGAEAHLFDSGNGLVAVAWAPAEVEATLPADATSVRVVDHLGRERDAATGEGEMLALRLGPVPRFITGLGEGVRERLVAAPPRKPGTWRVPSPSPVVLAGRFRDLPVDKAPNYWRVPLGKRSDFDIEVCNLSETQPAHGTVRLELPTGWEADRLEATVDLPPMGRELLTLAVGPREGRPAGRVRLTVTGEFAGTQPAPSVSHATIDVTDAPASRARALEIGDPTRWKSNASGNGSIDIAAGPEGGLAFAIRFAGGGDRWAYPLLGWESDQDWSDFDAVRFEYRTDTDAPDTTVRLQVAEDGGSMYASSPLPSATTWRRVTLALPDLAWGSYSPPDPDGRLDLGRIRTLLIGLNTPRDEVKLSVRNLELVGF